MHFEVCARNGKHTLIHVLCIQVVVKGLQFDADVVVTMFREELAFYRSVLDHVFPVGDKDVGEEG